MANVTNLSRLYAGEIGGGEVSSKLSRMLRPKATLALTLVLKATIPNASLRSGDLRARRGFLRVRWDSWKETSLLPKVGARSTPR